MTVAAPAYDDPKSMFDPLVDLAGNWTTDLAEQYLSIPGMPVVKYECLDGIRSAQTPVFVRGVSASSSSVGAQR